MPWFDIFEKLGGLFGWSAGMHRTGGESQMAKLTAGSFTSTKTLTVESFTTSGPLLPRLVLSEDESISAKFDHRGRPHCAVGPAVEISNGEEQFFWHGVQVPEFVIIDTTKITIEMIEIESNAELRRVLIERYGTVRYMQDCGAKLIHEDETGHLYRKDLKNLPHQWADDPIVMVKVKNSTPEPDGSFKDYWLRVPPTMKTAREAVAWTFNMQEKEYQPALET